MLHARILRYLDEVVRSGSIRQAAEKLNIASSAVNRQILALEKEFGTPIFERLQRGLRLTSAGELLIAHVRETLRGHERVQTSIQELRGLQRGTVTVATMNGLASGLLPRLATQFRGNYPGIKIAIRSLVADAILRALGDGEVDIGLGYNLRSDPGVRLIDVFDARLGAIVAPMHPLARKSGVRLSECASYPVVLADASLMIHQMMRNAFRRSNLSFEPAYETNSIEVMKYIASYDNAITFLSAPDVSEEVRAGLLVYVPILDRSLSGHPLALIQRNSSGLGQASSLFVERLRVSLIELTRKKSAEPMASAASRATSRSA